MDLRDAIQVMGTSVFRVICYGLFANDTQAEAYRQIQSAIDKRTTKCFQIFDDDWPYRINMIESDLSIEGDLPSAVISTTRQMIELDGCIVAVCMLDATGGDISDFLSPDHAPATYCFCFPDSDPVLCLDSHIVKSAGWRSVVECAREQLIASTSIRSVL